MIERAETVLGERLTKILSKNATTITDSRRDSAVTSTAHTLFGPFSSGPRGPAEYWSDSDSDSDGETSTESDLLTS
jgi:hypothetical protein